MPPRPGSPIDYRATTAEALADAGERFDVVLAMEVVEHVADVALFVRRCAEMVKPGGLMIAATLNRTLKSFALAIVGRRIRAGLAAARHPPVGQVRHAERARDRARRGGLRVIDETGVIYNLIADRWQISSDMDVNYMLTAGSSLRRCPPWGGSGSGN